MAERAQRVGERAGHRVPAGLRHRGDADRAAGAAQRRVAAGGMLAALEVRQQVRESPPVRSVGRPRVVDGAVPAHVGHRVDRAGPAKPPAAGIGQLAGVGLGGGRPAQSAAEPISSGHAAGSAMAGSGPAAPASSSSTRMAGSSVSRAASTQPAVPPPMTM